MAKLWGAMSSKNLRTDSVRGQHALLRPSTHFSGCMYLSFGGLDCFLLVQMDLHERWRESTNLLRASSSIIIDGFLFLQTLFRVRWDQFAKKDLAMFAVQK